MKKVRVWFNDNNLDKFYGVLDDVRKKGKEGKDWEFHSDDFNSVNILSPSFLSEFTKLLDSKKVKYSVMAKV